MTKKHEKLPSRQRVSFSQSGIEVDWLLSLKGFFINVSYHILVASHTLMALFKTETSYKYMI